MEQWPIQLGKHVDCHGLVYVNRFSNEQVFPILHRYCSKCGKFGQVWVDGIDNLMTGEALVRSNRFNNASIQNVTD